MSRPLAVVGATVAASVAWLMAFAIGARTGAMTLALAIAGGAVVVGVLAGVPSVRGMLKVRGRDVLWGLAVGGASLGATYALYPVVREFLPSIQGEVRTLYALIPVTWLTLPVICLVIVAEELLWRGAMLEPLRTDHPAVSAIVLSSSIYATAQLGMGVPALAGVALLLGLVWAAEAVLTDGLTAPLISHAMWTLTVFGIVPLEGR